MSESRWGAYVGQRLDELERGDGREFWEGRFPDPATVQAARKVITELLPPGTPTPSVVPIEDGHVAFIWHKGGWDIEIEVSAEDHVDVWALRRDTDCFGGTLEAHRDRLLAVLGGLAETVGTRC